MATDPKPGIDLATELGESFALPPCGIPLADLQSLNIGGKRMHPRHGMARNDHYLIDIISTGYVACGAHSGDAVVMGRTVRELADKGIAIGAHPSYPDVLGFGQVSQALQDDELQDVILSQIAALAALAEQAGSKLMSVKCHGALSFDVSYDQRTAQVMARTLYKFDPSIALVCMAGSPGVRIAQDCGIMVVQEAYIDRAYDRAGRIVSRGRADALITDPQRAVEQMMSILCEDRVRAADGTGVQLRADSFCLHSDTPNALEISRAVFQALHKSGVTIRAPHATEPR